MNTNEGFFWETLYINLKVHFHTLVIFIFHGLSLGHVSGHVGTCHVDVQQIRIEGLGKLLCLGTKIFKNGPELEGVMTLTVNI